MTRRTHHWGRSGVGGGLEDYEHEDYGDAEYAAERLPEDWE